MPALKDTINSVLLGAVISVFSTVSVTTLQAYFQRQQQIQQFLLEKRLEALKDFSSTIVRGEDHIRKLEQLEQAADVLAAERTDEQMDKVYRLTQEALQEDVGLTEALRAQEVVISALFHVPFSTEQLEIRNLPSANSAFLSHSKKEQFDFLAAHTEKIKQEAHERREYWVGRINSYQTLFGQLGKTLYKCPPTTPAC
jgi:hypothetical protein